MEVSDLFFCVGNGDATSGFYIEVGMYYCKSTFIMTRIKQEKLHKVHIGYFIHSGVFTKLFYGVFVYLFP